MKYRLGCPPFNKIGEKKKKRLGCPGTMSSEFRDV